jgi:CubicO group peptidase (beta-lactamase class C family)
MPSIRTALGRCRRALTCLSSAVAIGIVSAAFSGVAAQSAAPIVDPGVRFVNLLLSRYDAAEPSPGCAVGIVRDGALTFASGYGMADLEHGVKIEPNTAFYLASLSKQFTAMSILLLEQRNLLSLDDNVRKWVPEVPELGDTITLRQLLFHTSGLRDYFTLLALQGWASDEPYSEEDLLDLVRRQQGLNFPPGERFLYSNTGYALLGVVVKRASKMSLRDFAAKNIFQPLGMTSTQFRDDHRAVIPNRALAYEPIDSGYRQNMPELDVVGDGGVFSTVEDLARWDANFDTGRVGGKDGVALLQRSGTLTSGPSAGDVTGYAMGLSLGMLSASRTISMSGLYGGYSSSYVRVPEARVSVMALCNTSAAPTNLADQIATVYLPMTVGTGSLPGVPVVSIIPAAEPVAPVEDRPIETPPLDPSELPWLEGRYFSEELNMSVSLLAGSNVLVMDRPRGPKIAFTRLAPDSYISPDQIKLQVLRDRSNAVKGFTLTVGRVTNLKFVRQPF